MFAKNSSNNFNKGSINHNDELIRFIFNYHYDLTVGKVTESAFQLPHLDKGLSVSVSRLLNTQTRLLVIQSMENTSSKYIKDCLSFVWEVNSIVHISNQKNAFDVVLTPVLAVPPHGVANPAHAHIMFSAATKYSPRSEKKQYRWELMKKFNI